MKDEVRLWKVGPGEKLSEIPRARLDLEARLQEWLERGRLGRSAPTRINQLIRLASGEREVDLLRGLNTAIDQAMNTSRRMALAWEEVRNPRPSQHIRGGQVNVAEQQVVAGSVVVGAAGEEKAPESVSRNELGAPQNDPVDEILSRWTRGAAAHRSAESAVGAQHGAQDG